MTWKNRKHQLWTEDQTKTLTRMGQAAEPWSKIAEATGRGIDACKTKWAEIRTKENLPQRPQKQAAATTKARRRKPRCDSRGAEVMIARDALASRTQTSLTPRSLTARVFGDPPPGRSALDMRRAGIVIASKPEDGRTVRLPPPITLATEPLR